MSSLKKQLRLAARRVRKQAAEDRRLEVENAHEENLSGYDLEGRQLDMYLDQLFPSADKTSRDA